MQIAKGTSSTWQRCNSLGVRAGWVLGWVIVREEECESFLEGDVCKQVRLF
jgi:hypothetical protein